jgi:hypothetical protein
MNPKTTHSLLLTSLVSFAGVFSQPQTAQAGMIVVDFGDATDVSEANWNQMTAGQDLVENLIDVDGLTTNVSINRKVANDNSNLTNESGNPDNTQVPTDSPITANIGGVLTDFDVQEYWFNNLTPGGLYKLYIFSFRDLALGQYCNDVDIITQETTPGFSLGCQNQLYVNEEAGTENKTLEEYTDFVTVWVDGDNEGRIGLTFNLDISTGAIPGIDQWAIAGLAIEEVPIPEPSGLLGLGLIGGGMILRTLVKKHK